MRRPHAWYPALVIAAAAAASALAFPRLPERVPVHWGLSGEPDRFGSRLEGAWMIPAVMVAVWVMMRLLPRVDPRRGNYAKMESTYAFVINASMTAMLAMHLVVLAAALGYPVPMRRFAPLLVGGLLVALGNVLPRARSNWWFGVRTPWTLSSDRVWARTHRVGGYGFAIAGLAMLVAAAVPGTWPIVVAMGFALLVALGIIIYSYVAWRQENRS